MIDVQRVTPTSTHPSDGALIQWAQAALEWLERDGDVTVRLVDAAESQALNSRYRGRDAPTNVLSFPQQIPGEVGVNLLGDLVICAPLVAQEAAAQGKGLDAHYAHLVIHGVLHLLGYDHVDDAQAEAMERVECDILATLNFSNPYEPSLRTA